MPRVVAISSMVMERMPYRMNRSADFANILSFTSTPQNYGNFFRYQSFRDKTYNCGGERRILSVNGIFQAPRVRGAGVTAERLILLSKCAAHDRSKNTPQPA